MAVEIVRLDTHDVNTCVFLQVCVAVGVCSWEAARPVALEL